MYCLAVVKNSEKSEAFEAPIISSMDNNKRRYCACKCSLCDSKGYVAYNFINDEKRQSIHLTATTGGNKMFSMSY
jgi:hypothetical protein